MTWMPNNDSRCFNCGSDLIDEDESDVYTIPEPGDPEDAGIDRE